MNKISFKRQFFLAILPYFVINTDENSWKRISELQEVILASRSRYVLRP